jgi:L-ascorbate metabolism protein UlaG (beta-lactamase superfamily)
MHLQLIRNATMRLTYAGRVIVTDPYLGPKHAYRTLAGREENPTVDLPCTPEEAVGGAQIALISHLHNDHFDPVGQQTLAKEILLFCQPEDETRIMEMGFQQITPVADETVWEGITICRTPGTHGTGEWGDRLNPVSGFVLKAAGQPTVYWCGDTIWDEPVREVLAAHSPDIIITHSGGAELQDSGLIIMDAAQTIADAAMPRMRASWRFTGGAGSLPDQPRRPAKQRRLVWHRAPAVAYPAGWRDAIPITDLSCHGDSRPVDS